ncbi:uncharacterized protein LAESUDRAFT_765166, partial [Laetiporus sulphureus 93-53]
QIAEAHTRLQQQEQQLSEANAALQAREKQLTEATVDHAVRERQIAEAHTRLQPEQEQALAKANPAPQAREEQNSALQVLKEQLAEARASFDQQEEQLAEANVKLATQDAYIVESDARLQQQQQQLLAKVNAALLAVEKKAKAALHARGKQLARANAELKTRNEFEVRWKQQLAKVNAALQAQEKQLAEANTALQAKGVKIETLTEENRKLMENSGDRKSIEEERRRPMRQSKAKDASNSTVDKTPYLPRAFPPSILKSVNDPSATEAEDEYDESLIDYEVELEMDDINGHAEVTYEHDIGRTPINPDEEELDYYDEDEESASRSGQVGQAAVYDHGRTPSPMERPCLQSISPGRFREVSLLRTPSPPRASSSARAGKLPKNHRDYRPPSLPATPPPLGRCSCALAIFFSSPVGLSSLERPLASGPLSQLRRSERLRIRSQSLRAIPFHARRNADLPQTPPPMPSRSYTGLQARLSPLESIRSPSPVRLRASSLTLAHSRSPIHESRPQVLERLSSPSAGDLRAEEVSNRDFSEDELDIQNLFPHNIPIQYEYPVVEPLYPEEQDWLGRMYEQLEWADDYMNRFMVESRQAGELACPKIFVGGILLDIALKRFWRLAKSIRILACARFGYYLFIKMMRNDAVSFCDLEDALEEDLLDLSQWDLYIRQWNEYNQCFRPYHHMLVKLLYPKRPETVAFEVRDEQGYVLVPILRKSYQAQKKTLREGVAKTQQYIQTEGEADIRAEQEARILLTRLSVHRPSLPTKATTSFWVLDLPA